MARKDKTAATSRLTYKIIMEAATRGLAENEYWVIDHDEGALWDTASKRLDYPVILFCQALGCDWDEATESGFRLAKLKRPVS